MNGTAFVRVSWPLRLLCSYDFRNISQRENQLLETLHQRQPRRLERDVVHHDEDVGKEFVDRRTELRRVSEGAAVIPGRDRRSDGLLPLLEFSEQRHFRGFLQ